MKHKIIKRVNKVSILIAILLLLVAMTFSACLIETTEYGSVLLWGQYMDNINIGDFDLAHAINRDNYYAWEYEILPKDKERFIEFLKSGQYYMGTYAINSESYYLNKKNKFKIFKGGDECIWFTTQEKVWIGKFYTNKFYYIAYFPTLWLSFDNLRLELTEALFCGNEIPVNIYEECQCALTWEQIKIIYSHLKIDEEEHSVLMNCRIFYGDKLGSLAGKTKMYFNTQNNTIRISKDYQLAE